MTGSQIREPLPSRANGRASGKVILLGEHAVVHGVPAVVAGLDRGAEASATRAERPSLSIAGRSVAEGEDPFRALLAAAAVLDAPPAEVTLSLELPPGSGLGASAALGVATARALAGLLGKEHDEAAVAAAADAWEAVFHGNASGVDRAAAARGGVLRFVRGEEPTSVALARPLALVIAVAGPPANTRTMVEGVARLRASNPAQFARTLSAIHALVSNALVCLRGGDHRALGQLMDLNHMLLAGWMLSTEELEDACRVARDAGALGAKLTGSGGGGCIVALCDEEHPELGARSEKVRDALQARGLEAFACQITTRTASPHCHHHHD